MLQNKDGIVTSLVSQEEFYSAKSEQIIEDSYKGSLPAFIAAFIAKKNISADEADEIQKMIDAFKKGYEQAEKTCLCIIRKDKIYDDKSSGRPENDTA